MDSLPICAPASHSIGTLRRPSVGLRATSGAFITPNGTLRRRPSAEFRAFITSTRQNFITHLNLRLKTDSGVQVKKKRLSRVLASNANPSDGPDNVKTGDAALGPPLLTILAGAFVFLFVCWIIGSIVMWLVGLIVHPPS